MDLGASICTPKRPSCLMCPLQGRLRGARGRDLPPPLPASRRPRRSDRCASGSPSWPCARMAPCCCGGGRRRACSAACWRCPRRTGARPCRRSNEALRAAPVRAQWWAVPGTVTHTFTHFRLELLVYRAVVPIEAPLTFWADPQRCRWVPRRHLDAQLCPASCARSSRTASGSNERPVASGLAGRLQCRKMPTPLQTASKTSAGSAASAVSRKNAGQPMTAARKPVPGRKQRAAGGGERRQQGVLRRRVQRIAAQRREVGDEDHRADGAGEILDHDGDGQRPGARRLTAEPDEGQVGDHLQDGAEPQRT